MDGSLAVIPAFSVVRQQDLEGGTNLQLLKLKPLHSLCCCDLLWTCVAAGLCGPFYLLIFKKIIILKYADVEASAYGCSLKLKIYLYIFPLFTVSPWNSSRGATLILGPSNC